MTRSTYRLATTAVQLYGVGTYPIEVTLGTNPNYAVTKTDAALTVTKATLTVTADDKTKLLNAANPALDGQLLRVRQQRDACDEWRDRDARPSRRPL